MWAICAYFNPLGFRQRWANYKYFREHLCLPLLTVELSTNDNFQLRAGDAEVLLQFRSPAVLWHKERLLNIALQNLPHSCDVVAWLDCDVVFESDKWVDTGLRALSRRRDSLIQPFDRLIDLQAQQLPITPAPIVEALGVSGRSSVAALLESGQASSTAVCGSGTSLGLGYSAGHAWMAERTTIERHGFYDASIIGSGNKLMLAAACGHAQAASDAYYHSPAQASHYLQWAARFHDDVRSVGGSKATLFHLWHGDINLRRYGSRHREFAQFSFDPYVDLTSTPDGCWRWNSDKPQMHAYLQDYLASRREDG